ncbi:helix-turn-helix transcriptional regulator [Paenibacillus aceti]|uniref:Transcriptional regulator n=1 Tax=Paenibacillus aceti TaxID=1820010 RepID=A0ABQ1W499_9BACL|nr:transcriptional regulator [Paenibacillus aceti]GGG12958.1 hypothetical protein GCM10010913_38430 [Paenibacillus aceti]
MGRPAKMWRLTSEANRLFPDGYADLTLSLIDSMKEAFGEEGLEKMLEIRNRQQIKEYQSKVSRSLPLEGKLKAFAVTRTAEGYMAEIIDNEDGTYYFIEKHCPICEAARACSSLCRNEADLFQQVLGDDLVIERSEHILEGDNRCVFVITPNNTTT